jgi:hypothetical protein
MWGLTTVVSAFALALIAMSFAFAGGAVIVAVPVTLVAIGFAGLADLRRSGKQARSIHQHRQQARNQKVDFTERDRQTLSGK